jgi:hypothetical protein
MIIKIDGVVGRASFDTVEKFVLQPNQNVVIGDCSQLYMRSDLPLSITALMPTGSVDVFYHQKTWLSSMMLINNIKGLSMRNTRTKPIGVILMRLP